MNENMRRAAEVAKQHAKFIEDANKAFTQTPAFQSALRLQKQMEPYNKMMEKTREMIRRSSIRLTPPEDSNEFEVLSVSFNTIDKSTYSDEEDDIVWVEATIKLRIPPKEEEEV